MWTIRKSDTAEAPQENWFAKGNFTLCNFPTFHIENHQAKIRRVKMQDCRPIVKQVYRKVASLEASAESLFDELQV